MGLHQVFSPTHPWIISVMTPRSLSLRIAESYCFEHLRFEFPPHPTPLPSVERIEVRGMSVCLGLIPAESSARA